MYHISSQQRSFCKYTDQREDRSKVCLPFDIHQDPLNQQDHNHKLVWWGEKNSS